MRSFFFYYIAGKCEINWDKTNEFSRFDVMILTYITNQPITFKKNRVRRNNSNKLNREMMSFFLSFDYIAGKCKIHRDKTNEFSGFDVMILSLNKNVD